MEIGPQRDRTMQSICKHLAAYGGSLLFGDYAHWDESEDTFRVRSSVYSEANDIDAFPRRSVKMNSSIRCPIRAMWIFSLMLISKTCVHVACRYPIVIVRSRHEFDDLLRCVVLVQFFGPVGQGSFLYNLGMNDRLEVRDRSFGFSAMLYRCLSSRN